jgi:cellulose synthase/poly-beta-1,6-N-acetylglucosamine synthase-like glycosyltransferase
MDSDNVLALDFLEKINDPFHLDYDVVSGYRNVKNMKENWISAISGLNWHRAVLYSQRPRSMINSAEQISGTGFVMKSALLKDGWHFTCLTEDGEATTRLVAQGKKLGYCEAAAIYDEQPTSLKIALRQRLTLGQRWHRELLAERYPSLRLFL